MLLNIVVLKSQNLPRLKPYGESTICPFKDEQRIVRRFPKTFLNKSGLIDVHEIEGQGFHWKKFTRTLLDNPYPFFKEVGVRPPPLMNQARKKNPNLNF